MGENGRVAYLDFLKFFAIFSVLVGHATEQLSADIFWDHPLWEFIYSYHMPLFMFLCGFFFKSSLKKPFGQMFINKFRQLMVPSLTAFTIGCIIMLIAGVTAIADLCELSFKGFLNSVWFLKCIFLCYLIMYPLCKWLQRDWLASLVAVVSVILIPGADVVNLNFMLPMFCLGMCCGNHNEDLERNRKVWLPVSAVAFFGLLCFWNGRLTVYLIPTRVISDGSFDWWNLGISLYRIALGAAGTLFFHLLAKPVFELISRLKISNLLCNIGKSTLGIYFLQTFLLEILVHSLNIYVPIPWSYAAAPILAVVELSLCYSLVLLIRRSRIASFLCLGDSLKH